MAGDEEESGTRPGHEEELKEESLVDFNVDGDKRRREDGVGDGADPPGPINPGTPAGNPPGIAVDC